MVSTQNAEVFYLTSETLPDLISHGLHEQPRRSVEIEIEDIRGISRPWLEQFAERSDVQWSEQAWNQWQASEHPSPPRAWIPRQLALRFAATLLAILATSLAAAALM